MSDGATATIRMYRLLELGDCFLLTFTVSGGTSRVLIDCGSFRNGVQSRERLQKIATDVVDTLKGSLLDVVVGTHQHNDHLSGFLHCEHIFRSKLRVGQVWLSWLDDPQNAQAQRIGEDFHNITGALHTAHTRLRQASGSRRNYRAVERLGDILEFYGVKGPNTPPEIPARALEVLRDLGDQKPQYLHPGRVFDMPGLPADSVRVYVLGPPRREKLLFDKDPSTGQSYDKDLARASAAASRFLSAVEVQTGSTPIEEQYYPFNESSKRRGAKGRSRALAKIMSQYKARASAWRTIDNDWLEQAEALALFLDTYTNNSSLVLAFELVKSGKVLLFAADAQTGNWSSWSDIKWERASVTTDNLLARSVFYKVGHHGSHNATLVQAFEKMNDPDLVALIPVHKRDPNIMKKNGWKMPARMLFRRIRERTSHRVLQMDGVNPTSCNPKAAPAKTAWAKVGITPKVTSMFIEVTITS